MQLLKGLGGETAKSRGGSWRSKRGLSTKRGELIIIEIRYRKEGREESVGRLG